MEDLNNEINTNQIYVGLDIGTTKIVCLVGRKNEFGKFQLIIRPGKHSEISNILTSHSHVFVLVINDNLDVEQLA